MFSKCMLTVLIILTNWTTISSCLKDKKFGFNCVLNKSLCGWKVEPNFKWTIDKKGVVIGGENNGWFFKSPLMSEANGCFLFEYYETKMEDIMVFLTNDNKSEITPIWSTAEIDYPRSSVWRTVQVPVNFTKQLQFIAFKRIMESNTFNIQFKRLTLYSTTKQCSQSTAYVFPDTRKFFVGIRPGKRTTYDILHHGVFCTTFSFAHFTARVRPSNRTPTPIYIHSSFHHRASLWMGTPRTILSKQSSHEKYILMAFFYVSKEPRVNMTAVYYSIDVNNEILSIGTTKLFDNQTVVYVESFTNDVSDRSCRIGWTMINQRCFRLFCGFFYPFWTARKKCFENNGDLALLTSNEVSYFSGYFSNIYAMKLIEGVILIGNTVNESKTTVLNLDYSNYNEVGMYYHNVEQRWILMTRPYMFSLYNLCEEKQKSIMFPLLSNQSSTEKKFSADLAVDGFLGTSSLTQDESKPSWWETDLQNEVKIYKVKFHSGSQKNWNARMSIFLNSRAENVDCESLVHLSRKPVRIICEPMKKASFIRLQTIRNGVIELAEIEIFATENVSDVSGVERKVWTYIKGYQISQLTDAFSFPHWPDYTHILSHFRSPLTNFEYDFGSGLLAYFMAPTSGNYTFFLTGSSSVTLYFSNTRRDNAKILLTISYEKDTLKRDEWNREPGNQTSSPQFLNGCSFCFLKILAKGGDMSENHAALGIQYPSGEIQKPVNNKNLFWVKPGEFTVDFSLSENIPDIVEIGTPFSVEGFFNTDCVGLYCGDCPAAFFLVFENYVECASSHAKRGSLLLNLKKNWFTSVGFHPIKMGFQRNGNCSLLADVKFMRSQSNVELSKVGQIKVKPVFLLTCAFNISNLCDKDVVSITGWRIIETRTNVPSYGLASTKANTLAELVIQMTKIIGVSRYTGVCVNFLYKITGVDNTLTVSLSNTLSTTPNKVWHLAGDFGALWRQGSFCITNPQDNFQLRFQSKVSLTNATVVIAAVNLTSEACLTKPSYAEPGYKCPLNTEPCKNGQCIEKKLFCNGDSDCIDGSDEDCECQVEQYKCKTSGVCISIRKICDDVIDCSDGDDESDCNYSCEDNFRCPDGECVEWSKTCDGDWHCQDGADEPEICGYSKCTLDDLACRHTNQTENNQTICYTDASCDFGNGLCTWRNLQSPMDDFDWSLNSGPTLTSGTGPFTDHTTKSEKGRYLFIEASHPRRLNDKALLISGINPGGKHVCFTFYYHMFGKDVGSLLVFVSKNSFSKDPDIMLDKIRANMTVVYSKNHSSQNIWRRAEMDISVQEDYWILIGGVRGSGSLGDIAIDDILISQQNCSELDTALFSRSCSFESSKKCSWELNSTGWVRSRLRMSLSPISPILQDKCLRTQKPSSLKTTIPNTMAGRYRCLTFWYKATPCQGEEKIQIIQIIGGTRSSYEITLSREGVQWTYTDVPLQTSSQEYLINIIVDMKRRTLRNCVINIDEINLITELCPSFLQDQMVWKRKDSVFYLGMVKKLNTTHSVIAYLNPETPSDFFQVLSPPDQVNIVVNDSIPINKSDVVLGARVLVEIEPNRSVAGILINKTLSHSWQKIQLTIRKEWNGEDLFVTTENIRLLQYQLDTPGPPNDYEYCFRLSGFCYYLPNPLTWFDAVDHCKMYGGYMYNFGLKPGRNSSLKPPRYASVWIALHGHKSNGLSFSWIDGSNYSYTKNDTNLEKRGGLCVAMKNNILSRKNCSERFIALCRKTAEIHVIIGATDYNKTLTCRDPNEVLSIESAFLYPEVDSEGCDKSYKKKCEKESPNVEADVKKMCHGKRFCSLSIVQFLESKNLVNKTDLNIVFKCNLSLNDSVSCDLGSPWCGWLVFKSNDSLAGWQRENIHKSNGTLEIDTVAHLNKSWENMDVYLSLKQNSSLQWFFKRAFSDLTNPISDLTLCLWLFPFKNTTNATVVSFEDYFKIFIDDNCTFWFIKSHTRSSTNTTVTMETWQHICVSISKEKTWRFYKNGEMFASGETQFTYSPSILINIYSCKAFPDQCILGMFTKPNMWLKSLQQEEIAMVSRACGIRFPSIQELWEGKRGRKIINKNAFCIPGIKDYRITHRSRESSYNTSSTLISPWITRDTASPVCAVFLYHMLGVHVGIELSVQQPSMKEEVVWKVENSENSMMWKYGQVYIGLVLRFRIIFHSKVSALGGAVSVDNIFFKDGFCKSIPKQEWLIENPSGYITSPRYPLYYENNMKRQWEIQAATGQRIRLYFEYFNLEDSVQCKSDFLDIFDGLNHDRFCGSNRPLDYTSVSNYLLITFQSNHQLIKTGFKIRHRIIKENPSENVCSSDVLDCPDAVYCFPLSNNKNKIHLSSDDSLLDIPSTVPKNTVSMFFDLSKVVRFEYESFKNLSELEWLSLRQSSLAVIEDNAFDDLTDLKFLYLSDNHLRNIPTNLFKNTRELQTIDFGSNKLVSLPSNLFSSHNNMRVLSFVHNRIGALEGYFFSRLNKLEYLYLNNNELKLIKSKAFSGLFKLKVLKLHRNLLTEVEPGAFDDLIELTQLDLSFNHIQDIPDGLFKSLKSLQKVKLDHFLLCCHAKEAKSSVSCTSIHNNGFSSCDELLKNKVLQYAMWILGVMAFVGNLVVIIWRLIAKDKNRVNSFLLTNLAVADFLMGIYMMIIAYKNYAWRGIYFKHDTSWRSSNTCVFAGIISTVSSEVSVMMLCVITLDRVICIIFPFRLRRLSLKKASVFVVIIWLLGLAISFAPLMQDSYFNDFTNQVHFYGRSPMCLPLQLSNDLHPGWEFSVTVFIGFNGMSFLFILISYVVMYRHIIKTASAVRSTRMNQDSTLAKRMMFIILTDFLCWFPVIIMSILGLSGYLHDPNKDVYAWIAVFVLPINSSINPILYTFSTPFVRQKIFSTRNKTKATNSKEFRTDKAASYRFNTEFANIDDTRADTLSPERDLEQSMPDVHYCETSLVKTTKDKYCLSVYETFDLFVTGGNIKHSLKAEVDEDEKLCLVHIYSDKKEWQNMTEFMSWLSNESGHTGILAFSWSSPATDVAIEQAPECLSNDLSIKDSFFICYLFPGEDTLQDLFTDKVVFSAQEICSVSKSLIQALHYLQSKQIIHNAVIASNIVITKQDEDSWLTTVLGGFHHAQFWNQSEDDNEIQQNAAFKNDMISYGKIIKILLQNCHESEQLQSHHRVVDLCLNDDKELVPNAYDVLSLIGGIDDMTIEI